MTGQKKLINNGTVNLTVTLYVRQGSDPSQTLKTMQVSVAGNGGSQFVTYGDSSNPYLNGVSAIADEGTDVDEVGGWVVVRGSSFDNALNSHDTLTFGNLNMNWLSASNTWT